MSAIDPVATAARAAARLLLRTWFALDVQDIEDALPVLAVTHRVRGGGPVRVRGDVELPVGRPPAGA